MNTIYGGEPEGQPMSESLGDRMEDKFIDEICNLFCNVLNVNYNERRNTTSLLRYAIKEKLNNRGNNLGLLQQYEQYILDTSSKRIVEEFGLLSDVNHSHATHAKFADIVKELHTLFEKKQPNNE